MSAVVVEVEVEMRAQAMDGDDDGEIDILVQDARSTQEALSLLFSIAQAQASSGLRPTRDSLITRSQTRSLSPLHTP